MPSLSNNELTLTIKAVDNASAVLKKVQGELDETGDSSEKLGDRFNGLKDKVFTAGKVLAVAGAAAAAAGTAIGFNFNSSVEQAEAKLNAFMKDGDKVAKTLAWVKQEAAATQFSFTDMADAAANLTPVAKTSGKSLESLVRQAEILAALNPTEGLTGATFSLREALSGDWVSIVDRFNLPRQRINELKAQGVPAMEIISRTLQEMGIDYGLVAKQGQTVAARFDQVKDKLTMMAGAATKPIFERVSQELDKLGSFDYVALGENISGWVEGAIDLYDDLAKKVGGYLGPKLDELGKVVQEELMPVMDDWNKNVLGPVAYVLGTVIVVAVGLLIDALKLLVDWGSQAYTAIKDGLGRLQETLQPGFDWFMKNIWPSLQIIGAWFSNEFSQAWKDIEEGIKKFDKAMKDAGINIDWVQIGLGLVLVALVAVLAPIAGFVLAIAGVALAVSRLIGWFAKLYGDVTRTFTDLHNKGVEWLAGVITTFNQARERAVGAFVGIASSIFAPFKEAFNLISRAWNSTVGSLSFTIPDWVPGMGGKGWSPPKMPYFASGTNYAPGGFAGLAERGAEMVHLPNGARVLTANQTRDEMSRTGIGASFPNMTVNVYNQADEDRLLRALSMRVSLR